MTRPLDPLLVALVRALRGIETRVEDQAADTAPAESRAKAA